jgi:tellurite resistance protein TerA
MTRNKLSQDSMAEASRWRAEKSGHGKAAGAAGYRAPDDGRPGQFLSESGASAAVDPRPGGFPDIVVGAAWDNVRAKDANPVEKLAQQVMGKGVDLDLGCLYELADGSRGAIQGFGEEFGAHDKPPYIFLPRDERTGDRRGDDEILIINGRRWAEIRNILLYIYIYEGAPDWAAVRPQVHVNVPEEPPMVITPHVRSTDMPVCAIAQLENVRGGIRLTHHSEYFADHNSMDNAFGYGIAWAEGGKKA